MKIILVNIKLENLRFNSRTYEPVLLYLICHLCHQMGPLYPPIVNPSNKTETKCQTRSDNRIWPAFGDSSHAVVEGVINHWLASQPEQEANLQKRAHPTSTN